MAPIPMNDHLVEQFLIIEIFIFSERATGNVPHCTESYTVQLLGIPTPYSPKVRQGLVIPEFLPITHLIQFPDANAVFVRRDMLGNDVHGNLAEIKIRPDSGSRRNSGLPKYVLNHLFRKFMSR